jgi:hypothetical protein
VSEPAPGTEGFFRVVDWMRGVLGLLLVAGIGVAAILAGGPAGWALGAVLLVPCTVLGVRHFLRSP